LDLTQRIVAEYEALTGRALDHERIALLTGVHRLSELAQLANDPTHVAAMIRTSRIGPRRGSSRTLYRPCDVLTHPGCEICSRRGIRFSAAVPAGTPGRAKPQQAMGPNPALQIGSPCRSDAIMWRQRPTTDGSMKPAGRPRTRSLTPQRPLRKPANTSRRSASVGAAAPTCTRSLIAGGGEWNRAPAGERGGQAR
jgi:hypothetical protein